MMGSRFFLHVADDKLKLQTQQQTRKKGSGGTPRNEEPPLPFFHRRKKRPSVFHLYDIRLCNVRPGFEINLEFSNKALVIFLGFRNFHVQIFPFI